MGLGRPDAGPPGADPAFWVCSWCCSAGSCWSSSWCRDFSGIGAGLVVAIGIVLLISWGINRRPWELYGGTALIAIGLPPLLTDLRVIDGGPGWGTFFFGIALLVIAAMRAAAQGGVGWQAILGGILTVVGGAQVAQRQIADFPELDRLFWPVVILVIGVAIVYRSARARRCSS